MKKITNRENVRFYKFSGPTGIWSIIICEDEFSAKEAFLQEYHISDSDFKRNYKTERIYPNVRISNPFFQKPVSLDTVSKIIRWTPRVVQDFEDLITDPQPY
jgi:hypothetical protein